MPDLLSFISAGFCGRILLIAALPGLVSAQTLTNLNLSLVSNVRPSTNAISYGDVWAEGDIACLGVWLGYNTYNYGVGIYSISNPAAPELLGVYSPSPITHNQFELGAIKNRIGYFGSWSSSGGGGLHIVSLTNPASPQLLCRIGATTGNVTNGFDRVHTMFLERNYLYEAAHVPGITTVKVFDVSNPSLPVFLQNIQTTNTTKVHQITARTKGGRVMLYTSGWGGNDNGAPASPGQTDIWDVTDISSQPAQWLGRIYSGYNSHSSWPTEDGNTLIICRETPGGDVRFYDISNPATIPTPFVTLTPASMGLEADIPHNPVVVSNFLFLSWYQNGIQVFDITDRTRPVRVGFYDTFPDAQTSSYQGNWGVFPHLGFDKILLSDIQSGLFILNGTALLTPTNNYPPLLVTQPTSLTVTQGVTTSFAPVVTGSSLSYQWRFNGANIPGATSSNLTLTNVQAADAGAYSLVISNSTLAITSSVASLSVLVPQGTETIFLESFDTAASSNNWDLFQGSENAVSDYTVDWSFDYSTYYSTFNGITIPPAPNSTNGTTRGVRLTVNNNDAVGSTAGVSLYPKKQNFSGAYALKFDLWINYPGGPGGSGSSGSTEHFTCGINHTGTRVNWASASPSDGIFFAMDGEGGTTTDYRAYVGHNSSPTSLSFANSGFSASGASSAANSDAAWLTIFPSPTYESPGAPGKRWVQMELSQDANNIVTWRMNGHLIAQRVNTSSFTNGNIMIGFMDLFASIASPAADAFVLFDNVRVEVTSPIIPPAITAQPQNVTAYPENEAMFSVAATGSAPLTYQWRFNGANIPGATNNSYTRGSVQPEDVGDYSVVVANAAGAVASSNALLTLLDSPYVSAVGATPGSHSALISWSTTVAGDSQVQYEVASFTMPNASAVASGQSSFGSSSYLDPVLTTNHIILLTGLSPGTRYSYQTLSQAGTNTYVSGVYQFTTAGETIIDNPSATFAGEWTEANSSTDKYSTNYRFAATGGGGGTASATWRPNLTTPGKYDVFVWYPQGANRANNAPFHISFNGGATNILVNQQTGGGKWQLIASGIDFARGTDGFVRLANNANPSVVIADAVRFVYVEAQDFPTGSTVPTWWRNFFFGGLTDPSADADADGYTTAQEYVMGTAPTNSISHLQLNAAASNDTASVVFWPLLENRTYQLLSRAELGLPVWQNASTNLMPTPDGRGVFTLSTTNTPQNFYRLKVQMATNTAAGSFSLPVRTMFLPQFAEEFCGPFRVYVR